MKPRLAKALLLGLLGLIGGILGVDALGAAALRRLEASRQRDITAYLQRISMPRPVLATAPLEEDAAVWYKRAIAAAASRLSRADNIALGSDFDNVGALERRFGDRCGDAELLLRGARCSHCDWGLTFQRPEPTDPTTILMPARFLAYCLVQEGARRADASDWHGALTAHFAALRFAGDLRLNNLLGGLIGIDVARMGLAGLGRLITNVDPADASVLQTLERDLGKFAPHVLGFGEGPVVERLELFALLESEAQQHATARQGGLGRLVPWRAGTAYRMYQIDNLLRRAGAVVTTEGYDMRLRLAVAVDAEAAANRSPILRGTAPAQWWFRLRENADALVECYRMVQVAVRLEEWHGLHGQYPDDTPALRVPFDMGKLEYVALAERQGYRLQSLSVRASVRSSARFVLERRPRPASPVKGSKTQAPALP